MKLQLVAKCEKKIKGGPLGFFEIHCIAKYRRNIVPKKIRVKTPKGGILCFRGSVRRCFCFARGSGVSSMFWTSVVQIDDVEQMNKKVDRSR